MTAHPPTDKPGRTFQRDAPVNQDGRIDVSAYTYQLSDIYFRVHKANEITPHGVNWNYHQEVVQNVDHDLHALATELPERWWLQHDSLSQTEKLVQFWYFYLLALLHVRNALSDDSDNQFACNRERFHSASKAAVTRFLSLRSSAAEISMPMSLDIQAFAVTVFLLLTSHSPRGDQELDEDLKTLYLVHRVIETFKSSQTGSFVAREAAQTLTSLHEFFAGQDSGSDQNSAAALQLPFIGSITFKRASLLLGVGDKSLTSLPWSFHLNLSRPWPQELGFEQQSIIDEI